MPYEPITSSISMWAAADNSQDSLKALGQQLSCFISENLESRRTGAQQHRWPLRTLETLKNMFLKPFQQDHTQVG